MKKEKAGGNLGRAIKELKAKKGISQETLAFERNINIVRIADGMGAESGRLPGVRPDPTDGPSWKIIGQ